jgi:hypothetical protein
MANWKVLCIKVRMLKTMYKVSKSSEVACKKSECKGEVLKKRTKGNSIISTGQVFIYIRNNI